MLGARFIVAISVCIPHSSSVVFPMHMRHKGLRVTAYLGTVINGRAKLTNGAHPLSVDGLG